MIRLFVYAVLLGFFADVLRKAWMVRADSLLLPIAVVVLVFLVLVIKHTRQQLRRLRRKNVDFVRPLGGFPPQSKRDIR